ncbi:hypothetical protein [Planctomyces sp. SH-PL14]|uniref:hypothetical protein n=1 Tax=Planctomyces sp. SH-PL14 TaxID=1632864 RepID=UPI0012E78378|nr:hypothetical protein [Planctomyces sp. SH-PL14]
MVHKNPTAKDKGVRYYRPKPYLFVSLDSAPDAGKPAITATTTIKQAAPLQFQQMTADVGGAGRIQLASGNEPPAPRPGQAPETVEHPPARPGGAVLDGTKPKISIQMMYMPDFAEEYSIQLQPGLGIGELNIKLDNGWNLTSVGIKTDQQTDEIIKSTADLVSSLGSTFGEGGGSSKMSVLATNVPLGFYEAVIATDPCGRKQLYGWRYIGFMPFQTCPTDACGMQAVSCNDPCAIYGLVVDSTGVMRFERLADIPHMKQHTTLEPPAFRTIEEIPLRP